MPDLWAFSREVTPVTQWPEFRYCAVKPIGAVAGSNPAARIEGDVALSGGL